MAQPFGDWSDIELYTDPAVPSECADFPLGGDFAELPRWIRLRHRDTGRSRILGTKQTAREPDADAVVVNTSVLAELDPSASGGAYDVATVEFKRAGSLELFIYKPGIWAAVAAEFVILAAAVVLAVNAFVGGKTPAGLLIAVLALAIAAALIKGVRDARAKLTPEC
jgi:hypothetical protein